MTGDVSTGNHNVSLTLTIRLTSSSRFDIGSCGSITPASTILNVKQIISEREESGRCTVERQRLIYKGRILSENSRTLADYGIGNDGAGSSGGEGIVLYLVKGGVSENAGNSGAAAANIASAPAPTTPPQPTNPNASAVSNPFLNFGMPNNNRNDPMAAMMQSMGGMGGGAEGMPDLAAFQQQLQNNPQMMSEMLNNPMIQNLMNNPSFMSSMMENNPQMRAVMESNPELRHALSDPEFMRRSMEMMRDPSAMQNMMRNQDLAMSQIENMPGGMGALRRMYEDVQEPMMDAMASGSSGSAGASSGGAASGTGGDGTAGATNQAMPNPWGAPAPSSAPASSANQGAGGAAAANPFAAMMGGGGGAAGANPFAAMLGGMPGAAGAGSAGAGGANNPWNPAAGSNIPNLESTLQMMENPNMQQMMQQMMSNPETMRMMMDSNPMLRQMRETNPQAAAMLDNPEMMRSMMQPDTLRSMAQMQQAMGQLQGTPGLQGLMPPGGFPGIMGTPSGSTAPAPPATGGLDFSSLLGAGGTPGAAPAAPSMANPFMFPFAPPAAGGQQPAAATSQQQEAPGQRFRQQLQNLQDMGFTDRSANIAALSSSQGNVNRAIEVLLESPPEMGGSSEPPAADGAGVDTATAENEGNVADGTGESSEPKGNTEKKND